VGGLQSLHALADILVHAMDFLLGLNLTHAMAEARAFFQAQFERVSKVIIEAGNALNALLQERDAKTSGDAPSRR
jgi:hypothetical protein